MISSYQKSAMDITWEEIEIVRDSELFENHDDIDGLKKH
jgi:hypothetical protein